jgi:hypothetical protein
MFHTPRIVTVVVVVVVVIIVAVAVSVVVVAAAATATVKRRLEGIVEQARGRSRRSIAKV